MGCVDSKHIDKNAALASNVIDEEIERAAAAAKNQAKFLLFGNEYERNAFVRHMKICSVSGYSEQERTQYKPGVYIFVVRSLIAILRAMKLLNIPFADETRAKESENYTMLPTK